MLEEFLDLVRKIDDPDAVITCLSCAVSTENEGNR